MPGLPDDFTTETDTTSESVVVRARGELDVATVSAFSTQLTQTWSAPERPVVIDLSELSFIDSTGLRALVEFHRRAVAEHRDYRITGLQANVARTLEVSGLDQVLLIDRGAAQ